MIHIKRIQEEGADIIVLIGEIDASSSIELDLAIARSVGISLRVNLFGAMILEPYYARQLTSRGQWTFGLNFIPGW